MQKPAVLTCFGALALTACVETDTLGVPARVQVYASPASATTANLGVLVSNATASAGTWNVRPSQECGGLGGPVFASGSLTWADLKHGTASVPASRADLITVSVQTSAGTLTAADCVTIP